METNYNNIQNVIQLIKELDKSSSFETYIPSLNKNIKFKQLNTEQLKRLLKSVIDSPIYNTEFILTLNSIIKENCLEEINIENLTILDKLLITIKTRIESISPEYTFNLSPEEVSEHNLHDKNFTINLNNIYNSFISNNLNINAETYSLEGFKIVVDLPTIQTENTLEKELHKNIKLDINTPEELRNTLGDTFINELTKYIKTLVIGDTEINLHELNFKARVKIVEQLPTAAINNVLKYIESYKELTNQLVTFKVPQSTLEKELPQDATFFNM
jgi:hypothetical protein